MFRRVKGYVWGDETWSLARSKLRFRGARANLSQNEEWRMKSEESTFTVLNPRNQLLINTLQKTSKNGVFSTEWPFRDQYPLFYGVKIRILFDKISFNRIWNLGVSSVGICNVKYKKDIVEWNNIGMPNCKIMMPAASDKDCQQNSAKCIR